MGSSPGPAKTWASLGFSLLLLVLATGTAQAEPGREDVVYLKDGGILRGEIIEMTHGESLKILTAGRNVFVVMMEEVEKIAREPDGKARSGYMNQTGMDLLYGNGHTTGRFRMVNGYWLTPRFSAGLGVGLTPYADPLNLAPLFLDMNFRFLQARTTPYAGLRAGYSFSLATDNSNIRDHHGGFMINPSAGLVFDTLSGFGWFLNVGYNLEHAGYTRLSWDNRAGRTDITYRRIQFGFGLEF